MTTEELSELLSLAPTCSNSAFIRMPDAVGFGHQELSNYSNMQPRVRTPESLAAERGVQGAAPLPSAGSWSGKPPRRLLQPSLPLANIPADLLCTLTPGALGQRLCRMRVFGSVSFFGVTQ